MSRKTKKLNRIYNGGSKSKKVQIGGLEALGVLGGLADAVSPLGNRGNLKKKSNAQAKITDDSLKKKNETQKTEEQEEFSEGLSFKEKAELAKQEAKKGIINVFKKNKEEKEEEESKEEESKEEKENSKILKGTKYAVELISKSPALVGMRKRYLIKEDVCRFDINRPDDYRGNKKEDNLTRKLNKCRLFNKDKKLKKYMYQKLIDSCKMYHDVTAVLEEKYIDEEDPTKEGQSKFSLKYYNHCTNFFECFHDTSELVYLFKDAIKGDSYLETIIKEKDREKIKQDVTQKTKEKYDEYIQQDRADREEKRKRQKLYGESLSNDDLKKLNEQQDQTDRDVADRLRKKDDIIIQLESLKNSICEDDDQINGQLKTYYPNKITKETKEKLEKEEKKILTPANDKKVTVSVKCKGKNVSKPLIQDVDYEEQTIGYQKEKVYEIILEALNFVLNDKKSKYFNITRVQYVGRPDDKKEIEKRKYIENIIIKEFRVRFVTEVDRRRNYLNNELSERQRNKEKAKDKEEDEQLIKIINIRLKLLDKYQKVFLYAFLEAEKDNDLIDLRQLIKFKLDDLEKKGSGEENLEEENKEKENNAEKEISKLNKTYKISSNFHVTAFEEFRKVIEEELGEETKDIKEDLEVYTEITNGFFVVKSYDDDVKESFKKILVEKAPQTFNKDNKEYNKKLIETYYDAYFKYLEESFMNAYKNSYKAKKNETIITSKDLESYPNREDFEGTGDILPLPLQIECIAGKCGEIKERNVKEGKPSLLGIKEYGEGYEKDQLEAEIKNKRKVLVFFINNILVKNLREYLIFNNKENNEIIDSISRELSKILDFKKYKAEIEKLDKDKDYRRNIAKIGDDKYINNKIFDEIKLTVKENESDRELTQDKNYVTIKKKVEWGTKGTLYKLMDDKLILKGIYDYYNILMKAEYDMERGIIPRDDKYEEMKFGPSMFMYVVLGFLTTAVGFEFLNYNKLKQASMGL